MKENTGITLIALVVTIIILLILSAVTITLIMGPNGVVQKAHDTKVAGRYATIMDKIYERDARLEVALRTNGEIESVPEFIEQLEIAGLITSEDSYAGNIISIGLQKDGTYKYTINIRENIYIADIDLYNSLPNASLPSNEYLKNMTLIMRISEPGETVILPISNTTGLTINWDAGEDEEENENNYITPYPTINPTYTYSEPGDHEVRIKGIALPGTSFGYDVDIDRWMEDYQYSQELELIAIETKLIKVKYWGENNFEKIGFLGSRIQDNIGIPSKNSFANITNFDFTFAFMGIFGFILGEQPMNITDEYESRYEYCVNLPKTNNSYYRDFNQTSLNEIFYKNCNVEAPSIPVINLPENLFAYCPNVTNFDFTFFANQTIENIPERLFENCLEATSFRGTFGECSNITSNIPAKLFANCSKVTSFMATFSGCHNLTGDIPASLFDACPNVESFSFTFASCTNLEGLAPNLWERENNPNGLRLFY